MTSTESEKNGGVGYTTGVQEPLETAQVVRFGVFEANRKTGELRKGGTRIRIQDQPFQILWMLLEHPGEVVSREDIQRRLWPEGTFVEFEHSIGTAIKKVRQALGDDADTPRYIETLPRRGYRFITPVESTPGEPARPPAETKPRTLPLAAAIIFSVALGGAAAWFYTLRTRVPVPPQRTLTRLTFDSGLQFGATWSPDGRFIAYSSDRAGKFDIWVQQVGGINPVRITARPGHNWQPDWSPDGNQIVFRSEGEGGGLFLVPALGGPERKIASFGYRPRWSPDGRQILFGNTFGSWVNKLYIVGLDGEAPREILSEFLRKAHIGPRSVAWYPGSNRLSILGCCSTHGWGFWNLSLDGTNVVKYRAVPKVAGQLDTIIHQDSMEFRWGPLGRAFYFEGQLNGVRNIWIVTVDPSTKRLVSVERMTTGPGPDTDLSVSADGKRLAYAARAERARIGSYQLDSKTGRVIGDAQAITPTGLDVWQADVSRDGSKLAYIVHRFGKQELWKKSLPDGPATLLAPGDFGPWTVRWSPDGTRLLVNASKANGTQAVMLPQDGGSTVAVTSDSSGGDAFDWSPDGAWIVACRVDSHNPGSLEYSVVLLPLSAAGRAETKARVVIPGQSEYIDELRISPNGRWIVFENVKGGVGPAGTANAILCTVPVSSGKWTRITDGTSWDDKPRWSVDGRLIYFISTRSGFPNVWATHFDAEQGRTVGQPFQVTSLESPGLMVSDKLDVSSMSLSSNLLVFSMKEASGSIWVLDDVDK